MGQSPYSVGSMLIPVSVRIELTCRTLSWYLRELLGVGRKRTHFECSSSGVRVKGKHIGEVFLQCKVTKRIQTGHSAVALCFSGLTVCLALCKVLYGRLELYESRVLK